jgi:hypothetical protein
MAATKYDAMIAALNTIQNITDKPDWMLKEEELELREKMHNDELEMSLMMTQIKTGNAQLDDMRKQIQQYDTDLVDIRARILGTGKAELNAIVPLEQTKAGQSTPEEMFQGIDKKYKDQLINIETNKRSLQAELNKLENRYEQRGLEWSREVGKKSVLDAQYKKDEEARSKRRLEIQSESAADITKMRMRTEIEAKGKYNLSDPASITNAMQTTYADMISQSGEDGLISPERLQELAIQLTDAGRHEYAKNADLISSKLSQMMAMNSNPESFLIALKNADPMFEDFMKESGMPTYDSMMRLEVLSLSETATTGTTEVISPEDFIKDLINKLPPLVERKE